MSWLWEAFIAKCAYVGLLSCMNFCMCPQVAGLWEALVTLCALKWLLSCVGSLMLSCWETLVTLWAFKRLLSSVFPLMFSYQETLVTLRAFKELLSSVGPLMLLQGTWSWKPLVTLCTLEWLLSCPVWVFSCPAIEKLLSHSEHKKAFLLCGSSHVQLLSSSCHTWNS